MHEFDEYVAPLVAAETKAATSDPATHAIDITHTLAFHSSIAMLDKISTPTFSKAGSSLITAKPTYVITGDAQPLPYADAQ
ncbi:hypothetical protein BYT27DRAFT_7264897 [Phlegmacium glaucopus]|nr:hypothetical protein BYT27DRAFT_7264897 [Phlegmacium glaucopus]